MSSLNEGEKEEGKVRLSFHILSYTYALCEYDIGV